jgi:hypothetical protein
MPSRIFADVLARIRLIRKCSLGDLQDCVPDAYHGAGTWETVLLRNQLSPLTQMGLIEAYNGLVPLTAAEVARQASNAYSTLRFCLSATTVALEDVLGYDFWEHQESLFGTPIQGNWPDVFVVMPFMETLRPVFHDHIRPVAESLNLSIGRADDFFSSNSVVHEIWSAIYFSRVVIADCTGRNPNVFYEIGIAHAIGKPTVLVSQDLADVPFDLRHLRAIVYDFTPRGMRLFENTLRATIEGIV